MAIPKAVDISSQVPGTPAWLDRLAAAKQLIQEVTKIQDSQKRVGHLQVMFWRCVTFIFKVEE
jgi:hypothetical protein